MKNKEILSLRIKEKYLLQIASGEKTIEYRQATPYYEQLLVKSLDDEKFCIFYPFKFIHLYCGNIKGGGKQLTAEITYIEKYQYINEIPEGFKKGDHSFEIGIGKIIEKNL